MTFGGDHAVLTGTQNECGAGLALREAHVDGKPNQFLDVADIAACGDTVTFCLSKGLGAPAGSVLLGDRDFIAEARRWRKALGSRPCSRRPACTPAR